MAAWMLCMTTACTQACSRQILQYCCVLNVLLSAAMRCNQVQTSVRPAHKLFARGRLLQCSFLVKEKLYLPDDLQQLNIGCHYSTITAGKIWCHRFGSRCCAQVNSSKNVLDLGRL